MWCEMYVGPEGMYLRYVWGFVRAVEEYPHQAVRARVESGEMCVTSIKGGYPTGGVTDAAMSVVSESHRGSVGGRGGRPGGRTVALGRAVAEDQGTSHPVCRQPDCRRCGGKGGNRGPVRMPRRRSGAPHMQGMPLAWSVVGLLSIRIYPTLSLKTPRRRRGRGSLPSSRKEPHNLIKNVTWKLVTLPQFLLFATGSLITGLWSMRQNSRYVKSEASIQFLRKQQVNVPISSIIAVTVNRIHFCSNIWWVR